jgi:hypothetical protein
MTEVGTGGIPADPQSETLEYVRGVGTSQTVEWRGGKAATRAKFLELEANLAVAQATYSTDQGRSRVVAKFARQENGSDVTVVEELLGVDLVRHISAAPYFRVLTDSEVSAVMLATETRTADAEIEGFDTWSDLQKEMRWQMLHGQESYYETVFVLKVSKQGVRSSALRGAFAGINTVVPVPTLSAGMKDLVGTLPAGEWLYKPPQVTYVQRGIWNVSSEWHYAVQWSVVYGGTMKGHVA